MLMSAELKGLVMWFILFLDLPYVRYNCAKFHHCRIGVADFREGGVGAKKPLPIREQSRKSPSLIGLRLSLLLFTVALPFITFVKWGEFAKLITKRSRHKFKGINAMKKKHQIALALFVLTLIQKDRKTGSDKRIIWTKFTWRFLNTEFQRKTWF